MASNMGFRFMARSNGKGRAAPPGAPRLAMDGSANQLSLSDNCQHSRILTAGQVIARALATLDKTAALATTV